jgi:hypothetical protein
MGVQEEIMRLMQLREEIDARIQELSAGGIPAGATPGMGQNVGPDVPPMPPGGMPMMAGGGAPQGLLPVA